MVENEAIEALIICMGPEARQSLVKDALEAGFHVLTPKPPAPSLQATLELADVARRTDKTLMVNFQRRFSDGVRHAKELMARESFGRLSQLFCSFCSGRYPSQESYLLDFAIHHFDLCRYIGGEVREIAVFHNDIGGQGAFAVALEFENGAVGNLQLNSQRLWSRNYDTIEITGQGEYIRLDGLWSVKHYTSSGNHFSENYSDQRNGELTGDGYSLTEFVNAIREGREPVASIRDCLGTMRLYDAVLSRRKGIITLI
jgi:predicted dehydrogenase